MPAAYGRSKGYGYSQSPADLLRAVYAEQDRNKTPGQVPSGIAMNEYLGNIEPTFEQSREANVLNEMDANTNSVYDEDRKRIAVLNDVLAGNHPAMKARREEDHARELEERGEAARVASVGQQETARIAGQTQRDVATTYANAGRGPSGGVRGGSGRTTPLASTNKALDASVAAARGGGAGGGIGRTVLNFLGMGPKEGAGMTVDPAKMQQVISDYQGAMSESGVQPDVQEAAIALVSKFPGLSAEEKLSKLGEVGYAVEEISPEEQAMLLRALRMTGGL